jgi:hypothetical protein
MPATFHISVRDRMMMMLKLGLKTLSNQATVTVLLKIGIPTQAAEVGRLARIAELPHGIDARKVMLLSADSSQASSMVH